MTLPRRTQRERREATVGKLVDATIASILEVGYARTSVKEICRRAEVSHGGLFRHFPALLDLIIAAADEVAHRQIAAVEAGFARAEAAKEPLATALHLVRSATREPMNAVFYELVVAARTDEALRSAFVPFARRYADAIAACASRVPASSMVPAALLPVLLSSAIHLFDGEAIMRTVLPMPALEEERMALLVELTRGVTVGAPPVPAVTRARSRRSP